MILLHDAPRAEAAAAPRTWPNYRTPYRPDIEGLRAVAVLTVIGFHATLPFFSGGFVGVDVFFVISGFLITSLMLTEASDSGRVSLREFYARRARRILPGAATVLVITGLASWALLPLLRVRDVTQDLAMSALYVSNWRFISVGTDYLAQNRAPSPFLHFWSLAVEEQFYLVWPLIVVALIVLSRRARLNAPLLIGGTLATVTVASFLLSRQLTHTSPALAYMASPTRVWQFGCGALIAVVGPWLARSNTALRALFAPLGWFGLAAVIYSTMQFTGKTAYPGLAALVPTLGTIAIILSGTAWQRGSGPTVGRMLSVRPMRGIGRLSFAWYLWHWPALVLVQARFGTVPWPVQALVMIGATLPAWLTLRLIERPIRFSRVANTKASSGLSIGVIATVVALSAGLGAGSAATRKLGGFHDEPIVSLASIFNPSKDALNSGMVTPSPLAARNDIPPVCTTGLQSSELTECHFGVSGGPVVVLFGDSHAQQWQPALQDLSVKRGWSLVLIAHAYCPVAPLPPGSTTIDGPCNAWRPKAVARIAELHPALVLVTSLSRYLAKSDSRLAAWDGELKILGRTGAKIGYIVDTPTPMFDVPECISAHLDNWSACSFKHSEIWPDPVLTSARLGGERGIKILDFTNYLCPNSTCPTVRGGLMLYRDKNHITATLSKLLQPAMAAALDKAGLMSPVKR